MVIIRIERKRPMKQKQSIVDDSNWLTTMSESEREVAEILLELPRLITKPWPIRWETRRKRSVVRDTHGSVSPSRHGGDNGGSVCKKEGTSAVGKGGEAPSPNSPLLFPATESDEKINYVQKKASLKRKREHYVKIIQDESETKTALENEIDKVQRYHDQLCAYNLELKLRLNKLNNSYNIESKKPCLELHRSTELVNVNASVNPFNGENQLKQSQMIMCGPSPIQHVSPTASFAVASSSTSALDNANSNKGPLPNLDLNLSPEEELTHVDACQPLDENVENKDLSRVAHVESCELLDVNRVMAAAQARHRRIQIHRRKKEESSSLKK